MRSEAKILSILNLDVRACNEWLKQLFSSNLREQAFPFLSTCLLSATEATLEPIDGSRV
ncbi:hypothetical protein SCHPADRAFT_906492, partial [Schizopora paradoxa]